MLDNTSVNNISRAIKLKSSVEGADLYRQNPESYSAIHGLSDHSAVTQTKLQKLGMVLPTFSITGKRFGDGFIDKQSTITIPEETKEGTILEYTDKQGHKIFGQVVRKSKTKENAYIVQPITNEQMQEYQANDPHLNVLNLNQKDLSPHSLSLTDKWILYLDSHENVVFTFMISMLMPDTSREESILIAFVKSYLRIFILAIACMILLYIIVAFT